MASSVARTVTSFIIQNQKGSKNCNNYTSCNIMNISSRCVALLRFPLKIRVLVVKVGGYSMCVFSGGMCTFGSNVERTVSVA